MAANDKEESSFLEVVKSEFNSLEDFRNHLEYLKAAYAKKQKRQKLASSVVDKLVTAAAMALLIFVGNAMLSAARQLLGSGN